MKKSIYLLVACVAFTLVSCDNGAKDLQTPEFEALSAKYDVTDYNAEIESLELTASGNFIVVKNENNFAGYVAPKRNILAKNVFMHEKMATRVTTYDEIIYGKFTKIDKNKYELIGYGTVTITGSADDACNLNIEFQNGRKITVGARIGEQYDSSVATNNLCRTWNIEKVGIKLKAGIFKFDKMVDQDNMDKLFRKFVNWIVRIWNIFGDEGEGEEPIDKEEMIKEMTDEYNEIKPVSIIFTKSGSYLVEYANGTIGISTWRWENEEEGIIRYSWDTDDIYSENVSGTCTIEYSKGLLMLTETNTTNEGEEEEASATIIFGLSDASK